MSDYTPITDFSAKDALTTGDAEKIISGADVDAEFAAIQTAIATKYDSNDIASQAQAEGLSSTSPSRTASTAPWASCAAPAASRAPSCWSTGGYPGSDRSGRRPYPLLGRCGHCWCYLAHGRRWP